MTKYIYIYRALVVNSYVTFLSKHFVIINYKALIYINFSYTIRMNVITLSLFDLYLVLQFMFIHVLSRTSAF